MSELSNINELKSTLSKIGHVAADTADSELSQSAAVLSDLLTVAEMLAESDSVEQSQQMVEFCQQQALPAFDGQQPNAAPAEVRATVEERWGNLLTLLSPEERTQFDAPNGWDEVPLSSMDASTDDPEPEFGSVDLEGLLATLGSVETEEPSAAETLGPTALAAGVSQPSGRSGRSHESPTLDPQLEAQSRMPGDSLPRPLPPTSPAFTTTDLPLESIDDAELAAAFADDAQQCLAEMEASVLDLDSNATPDECLRNFCRQLHTLKGASGTVGLSKLADYLHQLESHIEASPGHMVDSDQLLECIDTVRRQLDALQPNSAAATSTGESAAPVNVGATGSETELFVRVEASRMERLMDLLSELVTLRNRRDTYVDSLRNIHDELNQCASRARNLNASVSTPIESSEGEARIARRHSLSRLHSRSLDEVSRDTAELSRSLMEVCDPLAADNTAVSQLIGRFRQELMELHRLPVSGLFQRLQRSIRDAAKAEGKQVEIHFEGQGARAERAVQERLFEPLLHLVRNAVSHGIQPAEERQAAGKPAKGNITLSAYSNAASLIIEVRDDGKGLNDEALEARGRSLGLLPSGRVTQKQLWNLIFQPGFSTKSAVSEISGRGVGMDVVDSWVKRLRGQIDVESVAGQGTTFRLQIPLRSAVEHVMVFRSGEQLFALPMHTVSRTFQQNPTDEAVDSIPLGQLWGSAASVEESRCHVTLKSMTAGVSSNQDLTLTVDSIVGVEEVVVRPLPSLLRGNLLFAGVTLSGRAETVLLLDARRLHELADGNMETRVHDGEAISHRSTPTARPSVLVVDDSLVVRKSLNRRFQAQGFAVQEAGDGRSAFDLLKTGNFEAVVTDIDMPGMNGVELLQEIRRHSQLQHLPVVVLSSRDELSLPENLFEHQPTAVLAKPVTDETIAEALEAFGR